MELFSCSVTERDFNNAGVVYMRVGQLHAAWDLFKGALEKHLAHEKRRTNSDTAVSKMRQAFIAKAETRYKELVSGTKLTLVNDLCAPLMVDHHGEYDSFCFFFVFRDPLEIPKDLPEHGQHSHIGLTIILNLALLEHYKNPSSTQVASLYKLASSLLTGKASDTPFEILIANNLAVWHLSNGDISPAERWMVRLKKAMHSFSQQAWFSSRVNDGLKFNLEWFASPRYKVSPAA